MESAALLQILFNVFMITAKIAAPLLLCGMVIGLATGLFQAVTQINDATFAFLPKVVVMALMLWLCLPWILQELTGFLGHTFEMMEHVTR